MNNEIMNNGANFIAHLCYPIYKDDWKKKRGYQKLSEAALEKKGEIYVCFEEFIDCEFQDKEYMKTIMPAEMLPAYLRAVERGA